MTNQVAAPSGEAAYAEGDWNSPKVSLIVPCFNTQDYLEECLESIVSQTVRELEIILVDDGSTDGTQGIASQYAAEDDRILLASTGPRPRGPGYARNFGIGMARGEFVGFVDSDDIIDTRFIEKLLGLAQRHSADVAMCSIEKFSADGERESYVGCTYSKLLREREDTPFTWRDIGADVFRLRFASWNKLYRRTFLERNAILFTEGIFYEDMEFTFKSLFLAERMTYLDDALYFNRRQREGATTNTHGGRVAGSLKAFIQLSEFLAEDPSREEIWPAFEAFRLRKMVQYLHKNDLDHIVQFYAELQEVASAADFHDNEELSESYRAQLDRVVSSSILEYLVHEYWTLSTENAKLRRTLRTYKREAREQSLLVKKLQKRAREREEVLSWFRSASSARIALSRAKSKTIHYMRRE